MPMTIEVPHGRKVLETEVLCQGSFAAFGTVIENPAPSIIPSLHIKDLPPKAVQANQGSAIKYMEVTHMEDLYCSAPNNVQSRAVMNMFVCAPRSLIQVDTPHVEGLFSVNVLERHPYTTQTFIPLGLSQSVAFESRYLVIVAPSLPPSPADEGLPIPSAVRGRSPLPGRGLPDLRRIRAFMAKGSQAVTYGAGTWHAPMVVIGQKPVDFVVVQFANGVGNEDCQEVELGNQQGREIMIAIPEADKVQSHGLWKL